MGFFRRDARSSGLQQDSVNLLYEGLIQSGTTAEKTRECILSMTRTEITKVILVAEIFQCCW